MIRRHTNLVQCELAGTVKIDGIGGFVGGKGDIFFDATPNGGANHVLRAKYIRANALKRIVFLRLDLLQGRSMDNDIDAAKSHFQPVQVTSTDPPLSSGGSVVKLWKVCCVIGPELLLLMPRKLRKESDKIRKEGAPHFAGRAPTDATTVAAAK
jgi:hypothetical protein